MNLSWMLEGWTADPGTVVVLALVLWLDGWRRVGSEDLVLVRHGAGTWTHGQPWARVGPLALVGWWPPLVMPLVVPAATPNDRATRWSREFRTAASRGDRRLRRVRLFIGTSRALGILLLAWIALGIPAATGRFGVFGLVQGIAQAFVLSLGIALVTALGLRSLGAAWGAVVRLTLPLVFPFTAPRAPEVLLASALRGLDPLAQAAVLMGETRFLAWIRPWSYDELNNSARVREGNEGPGAALVRTLPRDVLERAVRTSPVRDPSREGSVAYCPRCARLYRDDIVTCHDCDALSLVRAGC